jgi:hypothetical protein
MSFVESVYQPSTLPMFIPSTTFDPSPLARHLPKAIRKATPASPTGSALRRRSTTDYYGVC